MNQEIENIIKKNIKHCRYNCYCNVCQLCDEDTHIHCGDCVMDKPQEINTSLIADEVLKVVVESMQKYKKSWNKDICGACGHKIYSNHNLTCDCLCKVYREVLEDLLSNLSPNKENKNNG